MTRTRTQTTLSRLAAALANILGELKTLDGLLPQYPKHRALLTHRKAVLLQHRDSLNAAIKQFDPTLDPTTIGTLGSWMKEYGRLGSEEAIGRYLSHLTKASAYDDPAQKR